MIKLAQDARVDPAVRERCTPQPGNRATGRRVGEIQEHNNGKEENPQGRSRLLVRLLYKVPGHKVYMAIKRKLDAAIKAQEFMRNRKSLIGNDWDEHIMAGQHALIEELQFRLKHLPDVVEFELTLGECQELGLTESTPYVRSAAAA